MNKKTKNVKIRLHKVIFCTAILLVMLKASTVMCKAYNTEAEYRNAQTDEILDNFTESLPEELKGASDISELNEMLGIKRILADIISSLTDSCDELSSLLMCMLGIALLSTLASFLDSEVASHSQRAVGVVGAALLLDRLAFLVEGAGETLSRINSFFGAVIPISLAVNSLGAAPTTASTQAFGMGLTLSAYSFIGERMVCGIVGAVFICSALSSLDPMLSRLAKSVRNLFITLLGALTVLCGATFAMQSTISSGADSMAIRSARYAVAGTVPIVGNAVSGALGLVAGGVSYARSIVGGGAIAAIISLVLSPLVTLFAYRLTLKAGAAVSSMCSLDGCESIFSSFLGALDALIAVYSLTAVIYVTELVAFLKGGVSIA